MSNTSGSNDDAVPAPAGYSPEEQQIIQEWEEELANLPPGERDRHLTGLNRIYADEGRPDPEIDREEQERRAIANRIAEAMHAGELLVTQTGIISVTDVLGGDQQPPENSGAYGDQKPVRY